MFVYSSWELVVGSSILHFAKGFPPLETTSGTVGNVADPPENAVRNFWNAPEPPETAFKTVESAAEPRRHVSRSFRNAADPPETASKTVESAADPRRHISRNVWRAFPPPENLARTVGRIAEPRRLPVELTFPMKIQPFSEEIFYQGSKNNPWASCLISFCVIRVP